MNSSKLRYILIALAAFLALSAIGGGIGLMATNGLGMPVADLDHSPFSSYIIPGLILLIVFGGTQSLAAIMLWRRHRLANTAAAVAGFGALIWIFGEMYVTPITHWLQIVIFALGIIELIILMLLLNLLPTRPKG